MFPSLAGTRISGRNLYRHYKGLLVQANVEAQPSPNQQATGVGARPSIRLHDLRHWACSRMLCDGTPIKEVQDIMGHATVTTTLKIYAHVIGDGKRQAINRMGRVLNHGE